LIPSVLALYSEEKKNGISERITSCLEESMRQDEQPLALSSERSEPNQIRR
jgi:hypothetical protein